MARSQPPVSTDGIAIDSLATAQRAKERVERDERRVPIHACGLVSHGDCPC